MIGPEEAKAAGHYVHIGMADAAPAFVAAALDLLEEAEDADEVLVTDGITEAARKLREIVDGGSW